jgi:pimeloyl-ACP methyl ester carboxylesterase
MTEVEPSSLGSDPAALVGELEDRAVRLLTPCGEGDMMWRRWGSGTRTVFLFHGGHGAWSHWIRNIPVLAERYTVIAADLPGCGDSADPPTPYDGDSLGEIVAAGIKQILGDDDTPAHLVGFSFGGVMSGPVAARLGDRLASVTLVGAGGLDLPAKERPPMKGWRRLNEEAEILAVHRHNLGAMMIANPDAIDDLAVYVQNRNTQKSRMDSPSIGRTGILRRVLPDITAPLNGIWGQYDIGDDSRRDICETLLRGSHPELAFEVITGAGHWVPYEAAERFNHILLDMLKQREA